MPVDKFGRIIRDAKRTVVQETTASDLSVTDMNNYFVRRDGSNSFWFDKYDGKYADKRE